MGVSEESQEIPLILTVKMDNVSFEKLDAWRKKYFPPDRNFLNAHITLFHKLPGVQQCSVEKILQSLSGTQKSFSLAFSKVKLSGNFLSVGVQSSELVALRHDLRENFKHWLGPQDLQPHKPHVTLMNKTDRQRANQAFSELSGEFQPWEGRACGLILWKYLGGPWEKTGEYFF